MDGLTVVIALFGFAFAIAAALFVVDKALGKLL